MIIEKLNLLGCNMNSAMNRFMNDIEFYTSCLNQFKNDKAFDDLKYCIKINDFNGSLDKALTIKSIINSLELTPLYKYADLIVDDIKNDDFENVIPTLNDLIIAKTKLYDEISEYL